MIELSTIAMSASTAMAVGCQQTARPMSASFVLLVIAVILFALVQRREAK